MRYRLIATYLGAPYQAALGPGGEEVTLFAACPPPEELGFSSAAGHWRKRVAIAELDGMRRSRPVGWYRGARCLVLDDQGDRLHIAYLGRDASQARQLGYWEIDREVFEMVVPRGDVSDLTEEQVDIPLSAVAIPAAPSAPIPSLAPPEPWSPPLVPLSSPPMSDEPPDPAPFGQPSPGYSDGYQAPDRVAAWHGSPEPWMLADETSANGTAGYNGNTRYDSGTIRDENVSSPGGAGHPGRRTARRERVPIQPVFAELLDLAAIPQSAYAVDDEIPGAMCLLKVDRGYEVFASSEEARLEVRFFEDEEAAYFYLFGVLAAEAVRSGHLGPTGGGPITHGDQLENVSKYLRKRNCPNSPRSQVRVRSSRRG